jgi:predicted metal-dependent enzyme (double-stranded beta helix superfamily)
MFTPRLGCSETARLHEAVIHSVVNPLGRFTGAIHVYGGDFFGMPCSEWAPDTLEERPFDVERARRAYAAANQRGTMDTP